MYIYITEIVGNSPHLTFGSPVQPLGHLQAAIPALNSQKAYAPQDWKTGKSIGMHGSIFEH